MTNVFLTFLGTNNYLECNYVVPETGFRCDKVRFVQEATLKLACKDWGATARGYVFTTADAEKKNWMDNGHSSHSACQGLAQRISELNLPFEVRPVSIPDGNSNEEIWEIFKIVFDCLENEDCVVFDITHAFRSIPMLAVVLLNYAKVLKNVRIGGIYYGAFEKLGSIAKVREMPVAQRDAPILDLAALDSLMEWTIGIDRFTKAGDPEMIHRLSMDSVKPLLDQSKGKDQAAQAIRSLANRLKAFSQAHATCRGLDISQVAIDLQQSVVAAKRTDILPLLKPLLAQIEEVAANYRGHTLSDGLAAARWCLEHNLVQQGFTILQEAIVSHFSETVGVDVKDIEKREVVSQAFAILSKKITEDSSSWKTEARKDENFTRKVIQHIEKIEGISKFFDKIRIRRNDLLHAGSRENALTVSKVDRFYDELDQLIAAVAQATNSAPLHPSSNR
jgi:CRISPR-associated Csx2 family protein